MKLPKDTRQSVKQLLTLMFSVVFIGGLNPPKPLISPLTDEVPAFDVEVVSEPIEAVETPSPTPTPTPKIKRSEVIDYIEGVFGDDSKVAVAMSRCESRLDHSRHNDNWRKDGTKWSTDWGLFQVNDYFHNTKSLVKFQKLVKNLSWKENILLAKDIYNSSGWTAWSCYKSGAYLLYL
jgi:hypothetical protein